MSVVMNKILGLGASFCLYDRWVRRRLGQVRADMSVLSSENTPSSSLAERLRSIQDI